MIGSIVRPHRLLSTLLQVSARVTRTGRRCRRAAHVSSGPKATSYPVAGQFAEWSGKVQRPVPGASSYQSWAPRQLLQGAQAGSLDIGMISNGNAGRFTSAYFVLDLPFLFKRYEDMLDFLNSPLGHEATAVFEKDTELKALYVISFGSGRDIQTRTKKLKTPDDIKGLKIRTISTPVEFSIYKAWGANPTPVDWGQTYTALQQGVVEGMQRKIGPVWSGKFDEVVKHNIRLNNSSFGRFMSAKKFASLSEANRSGLTREEAEAWTRKYRRSG